MITIAHRGGGHNRNRWRMRCRMKGCRRRFTLRRHPLKYKKDPKCPFCGSVHLQDCEKYRRDEKIAAGMCHCNAYPFPHTVGNFPMRMCDLNPLFKAGVEPTADEWEIYQGILETSRTG